jgi:hypothetical protein
VRKLRMIGAAFGLVAALLGSPAPGHADPVADFYNGKTVRMLIGYGPGGGYDLYGRAVAQFLPRHPPRSSNHRGAEYAGRRQPVGGALHA